jgi:hypothetical protein
MDTTKALEVWKALEKLPTFKRMNHPGRAGSYGLGTLIKDENFDILTSRLYNLVTGVSVVVEAFLTTPKFLQNQWVPTGRLNLLNASVLGEVYIGNEYLTEPEDMNKFLALHTKLAQLLA